MGQVDPARSALMRKIKGKHSKPELTVRSLIHRMGYRFRLHGKSLPGTPGLVFPGPKKVIFVHGCFWHRHEGCSRTTTPKTRAKFWKDKFAQNVERDSRNVGLLRNLGWHVLIIWECQTLGCELRKMVSRFLKTQTSALPNESKARRISKQ